MSFGRSGRLEFRIPQIHSDLTVGSIVCISWMQMCKSMHVV